MVKRAYSNWSQVMHVWAQQNQDTAYSSNMSFEGPVLYSYATPIARFVERKRNKKKTLKAVLVTSIKYSVTTSAQQSRIFRALANPGLILECKHLGVSEGRSPYTTNWHKDNIIDYAEKYSSAIDEYSRAKTSIEWKLAQINNIRTLAKDYCKFFGLRFKPSLFPVVNQSLIDAANLRAIKHEESIKAKKVKEFEARKKFVIQNAIQYLNDVPGSYLPYDWKNYLDGELGDKILVKREIKLQQDRDAWRAGNKATADWDLFDDIAMRIKADIAMRIKADIAMRIKADKETIQTSQGAEFPVSHAIKAFTLIKRCKDTNSSWFTNGKTIYLGSFRIDSISAEGIVKAGCHTVLWSEIERIAKELGLLNDIIHSDITNSDTIEK